MTSKAPFRAEWKATRPTAHRSHLLHRCRDPRRVRGGRRHGGILDGDRQNSVSRDDAKHGHSAEKANRHYTLV